MNAINDPGNTHVHCTVYIVQCTLYSVHCTVYIVQCTLYSVHCTVYIVQCTLYSVHCTVYIVQCTLYISRLHRVKGLYNSFYCLIYTQMRELIYINSYYNIYSNCRFHFYTYPIINRKLSREQFPVYSVH